MKFVVIFELFVKFTVTGVFRAGIVMVTGASIGYRTVTVKVPLDIVAAGSPELNLKLLNESVELPVDAVSFILNFK